MKSRTTILFLKKKWLALLGALAMVCGIFYVVNHPAAVAAGTTHRQLPIYCVDCGDDKRCALSFDAAWGNVRVRHLYFQRFAGN